MIIHLYNIFILFIFFIKIIYFILTIFARWCKERDKEKYEKLEFWRNHVEFLFTMLLCILIIIIFNPFINNLYLLNTEAKILLVTYAFLTIITADWNIFINDSKIYSFFLG
jgi:uncharacterized membrane protein